jgi:hypothetical protein
MKRVTRVSFILITLVFVCAMAFPASAHTATAELLQRKVLNSVNPAAIAYATLYDIDLVAGADLRGAAQLALDEGGKVFFNFDTLAEDSVAGRIIVNPHLVSENAGGFNFTVVTASDDVTAVRELFSKHLEKPVAVIKTHMDDFGMYVIVSAKLDFTGMDTETLIAYSYDKEANSYKAVKDAGCLVDEYGFINFQTTQGGYIIITTA